MNTSARTVNTHPTPPTDHLRPTSAARAGLPDRYLTSEDIASLFGVPIETVYGWRKKRTGPPAFRVGKHLRYDPAAVQAWATAQMDADTAA